MEITNETPYQLAEGLLQEARDKVRFAGECDSLTSVTCHMTEAAALAEVACRVIQKELERLIAG